MASEGQEQRSEARPSSRSGHVATTQGDTMFVWGGFNEFIEPWLPQERYIPSTDVWMYHALVGRWYRKKTQGDVPPGTSGACATVVDGGLYIVGGHTSAGNSNQVFRLDLQRWQWSCVEAGEDDSQKMSPRDKFVVWEYKNRIYVFGGFGIPIKQFLSDHGDFYVDTSTWAPVRGWNNQLLILDPSLGKWVNPQVNGTPPLPRAAHTAVRFNHKVFLFGGRHHQIRLNDLHCFDLDQLRWSGELSLPGEVPKGRSWHSMTAVSDTHAILYGGYTQDGVPLSDGWLLDTTCLQWTQLCLPADRPRLWHTAGCSLDGEVLIFGGCSNDILGSDNTNHTNELFTIRCSVKSLLRICLDAAYEHHGVLQSEWTSLPKHLCHILQLRLEGIDESDDSSIGHNTKACTVS